MTSAVIEKKQVNGGAVLSVTTGLTKANELNLKRMVDLALNSQPKLGIVNFNMLKTFLLELLKALNLQNHEIKFADGDVETKTVVENALQSESQLAGDEIGGSGGIGGNGVAADHSNLNTSKLGEHAKGISILTSDMKPFTLERFHNLEDKLARFEQQIAALNSLPSNQHIIDQSKELKKSTSDSKHGPIMEVWQYTQLSKRLEANEEGLTKLTSLLQDLIGDINELKDDQSKNSADIKRLNDLVNSLKDRFGEFEKLKNSLPSLDQLKSLENDIEALRKNLHKLDKFDDMIKELNNRIKAIEDQLKKMVTHPDLELYVTWAALEENLKGIRESLDSAMQSPKKDETGKNVPAQKDPVSHKEPEQRYTQTKENIEPDKQNEGVDSSSTKTLIGHNGKTDKIQDSNDKDKDKHKDKDSGQSVSSKEKDTNLLGSKENKDKDANVSQTRNNKEKGPLVELKERASHVLPKEQDSKVDNKEKENESIVNNNKNKDLKESNRKEKDPYSEHTDKFYTVDTHHNKEKEFTPTKQNNLAVVIIKEVRDDRIGPTPLPPKVTHETQTIIIDAPSPARRPNTPVPSKELQELLHKLGTLNDRHEELKAIVEQLRLELSKKQQPITSGDGKTTTHLPEDLAQKLDELKKIKADLEELKNNFSNETNKRMQLESLLNGINNELDKIRNSIKECLRNTQLNKDDIAALKEALKRLDETKADKHWIQSEFERKADKRDLDGKVNRKLFDDTTNDLNKSFDTCMHKHGLLEEDVKKNNDNILKELEHKLDRLELDSLKDYIEKQMKKLKKIQKDSMQPTTNLQLISSEDDAAGLRKQLLRFHCISCDRPIDVTHQNQILQTLPLSDKGMRPIQTPRPYTTYELDQIRQFQKSQVLPEQTYDLFASVRQCGGPHTLTVPHKKLLKIPQPLAEDPVMQQQAPQIPHPAAAKHNEVQIQGQDGHIYKGRIDARLNVEMKKPIKHSNTNFNRSYTNLNMSNHNDQNNRRDSSEDQTKPVYTN